MSATSGGKVMPPAKNTTKKPATKKAATKKAATKKAATKKAATKKAATKKAKGAIAEAKRQVSELEESLDRIERAIRTRPLPANGPIWPPEEGEGTPE
jgi:chromosome segregation ATPase